jgi:hypothetical protein
VLKKCIISAELAQKAKSTGNGQMENGTGGANGFRENADIVERPERAPSVYENVTSTTTTTTTKGENGVGGGDKDKMPTEGREEQQPIKEGKRRGEKGEIWYELGCV